MLNWPHTRIGMSFGARVRFCVRLEMHRRAEGAQPVFPEKMSRGGGSSTSQMVWDGVFAELASPDGVRVRWTLSGCDARITTPSMLCAWVDVAHPSAAAVNHVRPCAECVSKGVCSVIGHISTGPVWDAATKLGGAHRGPQPVSWEAHVFATCTGHADHDPLARVQLWGTWEAL